MTDISFQYDLGKDVENFLKATKSVNDPSRTEAQSAYVEAYGPEFTEKKLMAFIRDRLAARHIDMDREIRRVTDGWKTVSEAFWKRGEGVFETPFPDRSISVYLTTDNRCTYNIEAGYFFVSVWSESKNMIVMHELWHFWTWHIFASEVTEGRLTKLEYNDIKESLTVLLNVECGDLLAGEVDTGYTRHREMRAVIADAWARNRDIREAFEAAKRVLRK